MYSNITAYEAMCERDAKLHRLEQVSGYSIDQLISLFAAGYELTRKDYPSFEELKQICDDMK